MSERPVIKRLRSTVRMRQVMEQYFLEVDEAARGDGKVAWCTSVGPAELLRSFGFKVYFPENHGAMLGSSRRSADLIPLANAAGYSPDICSYLTSDVGAFLAGKTPLKEAFGIESVPRPDVLVYNTNQCRDVQDWFGFYQRHFDVPMIGIRTPRSVDDLTSDIIDDVAGQHRALVPILEQVAGTAFDIDRLREVVASSYRCSSLWRQVLNMAARRPAPITFFDGTIHMGPAVVLRGDSRAEDYYLGLLEELEQRVADGVAAVEGEELRFYWEGMPVWGKLRSHAELFAGQRSAVVASTYCNSWVFEAMAPDVTPDPFEAMARAYTELFIVRSESYKEGYLEAMVEDFDIDGMVFHDAKTCPNNSNSRYGMPLRLREKLDLPSVVIHGDLNDLRLYSEEQTVTQLEALVEQITMAETIGR